MWTVQVRRSVEVSISRRVNRQTDHLRPVGAVRMKTRKHRAYGAPFPMGAPLTVTSRSATTSRRRSVLTGSVLVLIGGSLGLAACNSTPATDTAQTSAPAVDKKAGNLDLNVFQFTVKNLTDQRVPVTLCYDAITSDSCTTVYPTKDKPADVYRHGEVSGVVGAIPTGVIYDLYNPGLGRPQMRVASAANADDPKLKNYADPNDIAFPPAGSGSTFFALSDDGNYNDFPINGYTLRIQREGDATPNGDKVVWLTIVAAPAT